MISKRKGRKPTGWLAGVEFASAHADFDPKAFPKDKKRVEDLVMAGAHRASSQLFDNPYAGTPKRLEKPGPVYQLKNGSDVSHVQLRSIVPFKELAIMAYDERRGQYSIGAYADFIESRIRAEAAKSGADAPKTHLLLCFTDFRFRPNVFCLKLAAYALKVKPVEFKSVAMYFPNDAEQGELVFLWPTDEDLILGLAVQQTRASKVILLDPQRFAREEKPTTRARR